MPRGGARVNSGPPPDPNALRRDRPSDRDGWTELPAGGFGGSVPEFPLRSVFDRDAADGAVELLNSRELAVWGSLWRTPQAVMWQRNGWTHEVAVYVRCLVLAEGGDIKAAGEMRQWSDRLGLNPAAMLRLRWRLAADGAARPGERPSRSGRGGARSASGEMRDRLRALDGGRA